MTNEEWNSDQNQCFAMFLGGNLLGADGNPINDDFFLVCFNASHEPVTFKLPTHDHAYWNAIMRTDDESGILEKPVPTTGELSLERRSICVLFLELASNTDRASVAEQLSRYVSES
jgi:glycogen operon protein